MKVNWDITTERHKLYHNKVESWITQTTLKDSFICSLLILPHTKE